PVPPRPVRYAGTVHRGRQPVQRPRELPMITQRPVYVSRPMVELRRLVGAVESLVHLAGQVDGDGLAAAVAQLPLDDRRPLAAGQRLAWLVLRQLDAGQLCQPMATPYVVVVLLRDLQRLLD